VIQYRELQSAHSPAVRGGDLPEAVFFGFPTGQRPARGFLLDGIHGERTANLILFARDRPIQQGIVLRGAPPDVLADAALLNASSIECPIEKVPPDAELERLIAESLER
jgi:hypothetical protein